MKINMKAKLVTFGIMSLLLISFSVVLWYHKQRLQQDSLMGITQAELSKLAIKADSNKNNHSIGNDNRQLPKQSNEKEQIKEAILWLDSICIVNQDQNTNNYGLNSKKIDTKSNDNQKSVKYKPGNAELEMKIKSARQNVIDTVIKIGDIERWLQSPAYEDPDTDPNYKVNMIKTRHELIPELYAAMSNYMKLADDYGAKDPGGWIYEFIHENGFHVGSEPLSKPSKDK